MAGQQPDWARAAVRGEIVPLLAQRMRAGLWILLAAVGLFLAQQLLRHPDLAGVFLAIKLIQVGTILTAFWILARGAPSWSRLLWVGLIVLSEVCVTAAISGIIANEVDSIFLLFIVLTLGAAMLLPWGLSPQLATVAVTWFAIALNVEGVGVPGNSLVGSAVAVALASLTSLYMAYEFERHRIAAFVAEQAVRESEARKSAVFESALDAIVTMDESGTILEFNASAEQIFGYDRGEVLGRPMSEVIIPPALRDAHRRGLKAHLATGQRSMIGRRVETTGMRADGSEFPVDLAITRLERGGVPLFVGYLRDLTERRLAEQARTSATLVRAGREMMSLLDKSLIVERLCQLSTELFESDCSHTLLRDDGEGRYVPAAIPAAHACAHVVETVGPADLADLAASFQRDELVQVVGESPLLTLAPSASAADLRRVLYVALGRGEDYVGIHTVSRAGREPFSAEEESLMRGLAHIATMALTNARLVEKLEKADRIKTEFLSTMSHELRTPLAAVLGYAECLEDADAGQEERRVWLDRIQACGRDLLDLIESTLDVGRLDTGAATARLEPVRLQTFWRQAAMDCERLVKPGEVSLEWNPDVPAATLVTDPGKLVIVLRNLVGNGLKFTERGTVSVEGKVVDDALVIHVADTGIGIRPEDQQIIFELFRQADGSESRRYGGTGIGLYIVRRFVEILGGTIELESALGRGSIFTVRLPGVSAIGAEARPRASLQSISRRRRSAEARPAR